MNSSKLLYIPALILIALALAGCGPSPAQMTATSQAADSLTLTAAPTVTPSPSPTPSGTPTLTPTITPSPTPAATETMTETATLPPSPTPDRVVPGSYSVGRCGSKSMSQGGKLDFCVTGVTVTNTYHLVFYVSWQLANIPSGYSVTKRSDEGNRKMYLTDNLGKRYDHVAGGGAAYTSANVSDSVPMSGWFDFGSATVGAFTFDFHDDDNGILIGGLSLYPGGNNAATISYENYLLDPYPLLLMYRKEVWDVVKAQDGAGKLVSKNMPACTVQAQAAQQPQGDFKSQIPVGAITYDIYGYFDEKANFYVREYIYVSGLSGLEASVKPFF